MDDIYLYIILAFLTIIISKFPTKLLKKNGDHMVDIKIDGYPLTVLYPIAMNNEPLVAGGGIAIDYQHYELQLFARSLALTSDLEKLPILYSINPHLYFSNLIFATLAGAGMAEVNVFVYVFNGDIDIMILDDLAVNTTDAQMSQQIIESDNLIYLCNRHIFYDSTNHVATIDYNEPIYVRKGGELLSNEINIVLRTECDGAPVGNNFYGDSCNLFMTIEVDWQKVSKNKIDDYIREAVYSKK